MTLIIVLCICVTVFVCVLYLCNTVCRIAKLKYPAPTSLDTNAEQERMDKDATLKENKTITFDDVLKDVQEIIGGTDDDE